MERWLETSPDYRPKLKIPSRNKGSAFKGVWSHVAAQKGIITQVATKGGAARVTMGSVENRHQIPMYWSGRKCFECEQPQNGRVIEEIGQGL